VSGGFEAPTRGTTMALVSRADNSAPSDFIDDGKSAAIFKQL
jgi:hypothetical protein